MKNYSLVALLAVATVAACTQKNNDASAQSLEKPVKQSVEKCLFTTEDHSRLVAGPEFTTFKISRMTPRITDQLVAVHVRELKDTKTGKVYQENRTFTDVDDGGNTLIWVEDMTFVNGRNPSSVERGQIVAIIGDGNVESCSVSE